MKAEDTSDLISDPCLFLSLDRLPQPRHLLGHRAGWGRCGLASFSLHLEPDENGIWSGHSLGRNSLPVFSRVTRVHAADTRTASNLSEIGTAGVGHGLATGDLVEAVVNEQDP